MGAQAHAHLSHLARQVRALSRASREVDYDDPAAEAEYYHLASGIIEAVIAMPARTIAGLTVKAEALAWCYGGPIEVAADATAAERIVASMLTDLLGPDTSSNENIRGTSA